MFECYPCVRTGVTYVSGLYRHETQHKQGIFNIQNTVGVLPCVPAIKWLFKFIHDEFMTPEKLVSHAFEMTARCISVKFHLPKTEKHNVKTNTRIDALVPWSPEFDRDKPLFEPLRPLLTPFREYTEWPGLETYQQLLDSVASPLRTQHGATLKIVAQEGRPDHFEQHYAPRIYLHGEIQTRTKNWHDFFQLLTWFIFPKTKAVINAIHIPRAKQRIANGDVGRRSPVENMLSLFDEGGVVITSCEPALLQLIRDFKWKELFWQRRDELAGKFECTTFGHAMYEKTLAPYTGMTANAILLVVDESHFAKPMNERLAYIDEQLAASFAAGEQYTQPHDLNPFPILGMPGWHADNSVEAYYDNQNYFRPGRRAKPE